MVVPNLEEARAQLDRRFPKRDKASDGAIGDTRHQASASSHNPDRTGSPEWRDGDAKDEVRARDFDKDLRDPGGVTMEHVVQLWVRLARAGVLWWIRYIIYNGRIWHRRDGFKTHTYTGSNKHDQHCHTNSEFSQKADQVTGTNWHLDELGSAPKPPSAPPSKPKPAPGPRLPFPLPAGYYFGRDDGDDESVSGKYNRRFKGKTDRQWLVEFGKQLARRGWAIGRGKRWLGGKDGNNGVFGPEYDGLVRAFQADQGLTVDGELGAKTWAAAFNNPVT
ncbi:peptidoglycan-binding protein [Micromonospora sp. STR1s_5]|nr:peptidoglycan-binding protein [Micromonospora sp. STR1s_5]